MGPHLAPQMGPSLAHYGPRLGLPVGPCPGPIMGPHLGPPWGHDGPKLEPGPIWAQTWAPRVGPHLGPLWAMIGSSLPRANYEHTLGPSMGYDGPP
jgi:hypothetical protein